MAEENDTEQDEGGAGSKKLLIVGLLAGLVLGGGGGATAFMFLGGNESPMPAGAEQAQEKIPEAEEETAPPKDLHFVKMERFTAPLVHKGRVLNYMVMDLSLEVEGNEDKLRVVRNLPLIRSALLQDVSEMSIGRADNPYMVDYPALTARLQKISNDVIGRDAVRRVLVVEARGH